MYGNYYDYGDPKLKNIRETTKDIMTDTRNAVSNLGTGSTYDSVQAGMGDALANAGVGNVSSFLAEAYTPNVPTSTPSYSSFMADTPQRIQDSIAAKQVAYNAGQADRMKDFQDLLKEVKTYSYGGSTYDSVTDPGPGAEAPAVPELEALMPKFKDGNETKTENSLAEYEELYGPKFTANEYNELLEGGVDEDKLNSNLMAYNAAGGNVGDKVFGLMGYDTYDPNEIPSNLMGPHQQTHAGNLIVPKPDEELQSIFSAPPENSLAAKYLGTSTSTPSDVFSNPPENSAFAGYGITGTTSTQGPLAPAVNPVDPSSLLSKFKDGNETKLANSMTAYDDMFGKSVSMKEYNNLLDQGVAQSFLDKNLLKYQAAGGTLKDKLNSFLNG